MGKDDSFLGKGWSFPPTFHDTGIVGIEMVEKELDIKQSLEILLSTPKGERIMLPDFGCDIQSFLFDSINNSKMHLLKEMIKSSILKYEPRVKLNDVIIDHSDFLDGIIKLKLDYTVVITNSRFNMVFPYYKLEGSGIPQLYQKKSRQDTNSSKLNKQ